MTSQPSPSSNTPSPTKNGTNGHSNGHSNGHAPREFIPMVPAPQVMADEGDDFDLSNLLTVLKRRALTFVGVASLTALGLAFWHITRPPSYRGGFELLVEPVTVVNNLGLGEAQGLPDQSGLDYDSQIRVLRSPTVLEPILANIQARYPQITYGELISKLSIGRQGDSKIIGVSYRDADPEVVEFVMSELARGFVDYSVQDRQADLRRGLEFLDEQLDEKWQEVAAIESELSDFQKQHDLVDVGAVSTSVTERMNSMLAEQEDLRVEFTSLQTLYGNLQQQVGFPPDAAVRVANLSASPTYQSLLNDYRLLEQEIALEEARFQSDTPMIQALEDEQSQLLPLLQEEASRILGASALNPQEIGYQGEVSQTLVQQLVDTINQIQMMETKDQAITEVIEVLQNEIQYLADLGRSFKQIERELSVAESSLNQLLATRQELRFEMAQQNAPWELMSPLNASAIAPMNNLPRKLVLSGVVGLLLGGAAALLQDKLDRVFHNADDIVESTKLPSLAAIPYVKKLEQQALLMDVGLVATVPDFLEGQRPTLVSQKSPSSFAFGEAFYSLHTNLRLLGADHPMQVVTVTSAQPGEGKSTVSAHLAIAATHMDQRVLLIDADMRQPTQHEIFGLSGRMGLSNIITRNQPDDLEVIQSVPDNPNLKVLCAGVTPPAPGGLLSSQRMRTLVQNLRQQFDLIIIDTPPMMGITDAKLASTHADGLLMVTQIGRTSRSDIKRVLSDLQNTVQAPLLGLVLNGVDPRNSGSYYNRYYYSYYNPQRPR
jgi:succinoglycan biosynthesis transport protein ExoP